MTEIYKLIADLRPTFVELARNYTTDENEIQNSVQELMLYFMTMNNNTLKKVYKNDKKNGLLKYGNVVLKRSLTSTYSRYYYKYRKYYSHISDKEFISTTSANNFGVSNKKLSNYPELIEDYPKWEKLESIDKALQEIYWYDSKVFQLYYYEGNTLDSLAKKTGISRNSLFTTIDKVRELLKDKLND
jgi:RNA polymerase sigma factor (sigma-70 family)